MGIFNRGRPSRQSPPKAPGEYRIRDKDTGKIKYIGETNNLSRRVKEHNRGSFPSKDNVAEWQRADRDSTSQERRLHEKRKIDQHQPPMNQRRGGGGRIADR